MNPRQQRFVEEYLVDLNATQAAIRAGYAPAAAQEQSSRLLCNAMIQAAIQDAKAARSKATGISAEIVVRELARLGLSDVRKLFRNGSLLPPEELDDDTAAAVAAVEVVTVSKGEGEVEHIAKIKLWDKGAALDKLMRHLGSYAEDKIALKVEDLTPEQRKARIEALLVKRNAGG